jgi:glucose/arabinose dehydrogenase
VLGCGDSISSSGPDDDDAPAPRGAELTNAFLNLEFTEPIALSGGPAGLPRLYVAERFGYIHQFDNDLQVEGTFAFLDIQDRVLDDGEDGGLRGFAFHPDWGVNGEVYVHYVAANPRRSVISRFLNAAGTQDHLDPASEEVLLEIEQPEGLRPGGALRFGPDGYLYIALGDGGAEEEAQELSSLRGSILRIDVGGASQGLPYLIPTDNPLVGNGDGFREEIYAWGFRDPAGLAFDPLTGKLWVPDRGERLFDELNTVAASGNYGWNVMEARACHAPPTGCVSDGLTGPVFEYGGTLLPRGVAGGFVYQGSRNPELRGRYLMADRRTGQVWAIDYDGAAALGERLVLGTPGFIAIGLDDGREPLFANTEDGRIYRFVWTSP